MLVFSAAAPGAKASLWLRSIDEVTPHHLQGTEDAGVPFWSPDGRSVAFFANTKLKRISAAGGPTQVIADGIGVPRGGTWGTNDIIYFGMGNNAIYRVQASGGAFTAITKLDASKQEGMHLWPHLLPGGRHFLYTIRSALAGHGGLYAGALDGTPTKFLVGQDSSGVYASPGYLLWVEGDTLVAQAFNADRIELQGEAFTVATGAGRSSTAASGVSVSSSATTLAYAGVTLKLGRV